MVKNILFYSWVPNKGTFSLFIFEEKSTLYALVKSCTVINFDNQFSTFLQNGPEATLTQCMKKSIFTLYNYFILYVRLLGTQE